MSTSRSTKDYFTLATLFCLFVFISFYNWQDSEVWRMFDPAKIAEPRLDSAAVKAFGEHIHEFYKSVALPVSAPTYRDKATGKTYSIEELIWEKGFGEDLCIADVNIKRSEHGRRSLSEADVVSSAMTNHFLYASIHGYTYHAFHIDPTNDELGDNIWVQLPQLRPLLDQCRFVVVVDAEVVFHHLEVPLEWLLNRWNFTASTSMAMPWDTTYHNDRKRPRDGEIPGARSRNGLLNIHAGIIVAQRLPRTIEMIDSWIDCAKAGSQSSACERSVGGSSVKTGGTANYIRYHFEKSTDVVTIPCEDVNGYVEHSSSCTGTFIRHQTAPKGTTEGDAGQLLLASLSSVLRSHQEE